ncbi:hypothetical protein [Kitasatospora azatica]|uniref:hypothetical protein n=1 Tax=Kitasatospora azatica TaxID=58347 RepID=UPI000689D9F0|nr:hypothetical protein [Kitasatospora azatica]
MPEKTKRPTSGRRIDLSVTQVAASALAAVVGAVLASELGVYGTVIGVAVVSIGATTGGAVFQHLFKRTGEQLREATDRGPGSSLNELRQVAATDTAPLPAAWRPDAPPSSAWNVSPARRAGKRRGWRTCAALSGLVFVLAMTPIVVTELVAGKTMHAITTGQDGGGTSVVPGSGGKGSTPAPARSSEQGAPPSPPASDSATPSPSPSTNPSTSPSPSPSSSPSANPSSSPSPSGTPSPGPSPSAPPTPTPTPNAATGTPSDPATAQAPPAASGTPSP